MLLIDKKLRDSVLFINRELAELKEDTKYAPLLKLTKLVKKSSNLTKTGKEKLYRLITHSLACFIEFVRWSCFCFAKGLTDGLSISRARSRGGIVAVGFSG